MSDLLSFAADNENYTNNIDILENGRFSQF